MEVPTLVLFFLMAVGLLVVALLLLRLQRSVQGLERNDPSPGMVLLQTQMDALREQTRSSLEGGRLEIDQRLAETNRVVGQVRQGLGEVDRQVQSVSEAARDLRGLQEMLRSPKMRGGLGEYMLAELLGQVLPTANFSLQHAFPGGERVDAAIHLGDRIVPVDAKFPLDNYRKFALSDDADQRRSALRTFGTDVRRHIDDIAKRYILPGEGTYDFALMYIPAEAVYQDALLQEGEPGMKLFEYALTRRVIPVSPQSFYAYLQVIVLGLRGLSIEGRAEEILNRLGVIRSRLDRFMESFDISIKHLANAQRQMEEARRRLDRLDATLDGIATDREQLSEGDPSRAAGRGA